MGSRRWVCLWARHCVNCARRHPHEQQRCSAPRQHIADPPKLKHILTWQPSRSSQIHAIQEFDCTRPVAATRMCRHADMPTPGGQRAGSICPTELSIRVCPSLPVCETCGSGSFAAESGLFSRPFYKPPAWSPYLIGAVILPNHPLSRPSPGAAFIPAPQAGHRAARPPLW